MSKKVKFTLNEGTGNGYFCGCCRVIKEETHEFEVEPDEVYAELVSEFKHHSDPHGDCDFWLDICEDTTMYESEELPDGRVAWFEVEEWGSELYKSVEDQIKRAQETIEELYKKSTKKR